MMDFIQIDETDKVVKALEANLFSYFANFGRTPLGELNESSNLLYFSTGIASLFHNGVFRARLQVGVKLGKLSKRQSNRESL